MGCFDVLVCDYLLPDHKEFQDRTFQTKSLGAAMGRFKIKESGELVKLQKVDGELIGSHWPHYGAVNFYTNVDDEGQYLTGGQSGWIEYSALFNDGWLTSIVETKYKPPGEKLDIKFNFETEPVEEDHSHEGEEPAWTTEIEKKEKRRIPWGAKVKVRTKLGPIVTKAYGRFVLDKTYYYIDVSDLFYGLSDACTVIVEETYIEQLEEE